MHITEHAHKIEHERSLVQHLRFPSPYFVELRRTLYLRQTNWVWSSRIILYVWYIPLRKEWYWYWIIKKTIRTGQDGTSKTQTLAYNPTILVFIYYT